jgi:hypothetical protein
VLAAIGARSPRSHFRGRAASVLARCGILLKLHQACDLALSIREDDALELAWGGDTLGSVSIGEFPPRAVLPVKRAYASHARKRAYLFVA